MKTRKCVFLAAVSLAIAALFVSCAKKEENQAETVPPAGDEGVTSYVSENVSFGIFFDEAGTKRTLTLEKDRREFDCWVIVQVPEEMEISAVQWQLEIPEGVVLDIDRFNKSRIMLLGQIENSLSERFKPCLPGPKAVIHQLTFKVTGELKDATFSILPAKDGNFLGITDCSERFDLIRASSYKAVVNPVN